MSLVPLIIQLVSGAIGGNIAGAALKRSSLGTVGNTVAGIFGGGLGGQLLGMLGSPPGVSGVDLAAIIESVASGGVGGGALMAIVGLIKPAAN